MQEPRKQPHLDAKTEPGRVTLRAAGRWTAVGATTMAELLKVGEPRTDPGTLYEFDGSQVEAIDTYWACMCRYSVMTELPPTRPWLIST